MQDEVSRYLFLAGGLVLVLLGVAHAILTPGTRPIPPGSLPLIRNSLG